ncbi:MAG TPA: RDD family protein [Bacteroidota bacterium]|nr:RDD family protein [Bacteroidota bacterium]
METISIPTTQNINLEYDLAGVGDRVIAFLFDALAQGAYGAVIVLGVTLSGIGEFLEPWMWIGMYLPIFVYEVVMESFFKGQTLGKMVRGIRVIQINGAEPTIGSYILRWLLRLVEITFCGGSIALIVLLINGRGQRLGDLAAGTTVVRMRRKVTLGETLLTAVPEAYKPVFREAALLSDRDIETIKEVLLASPKDDYYAEIRIKLQYKTKAIIERKMGIQSTMIPRKFLETVLADYNYLKGRM